MKAIAAILVICATAVLVATEHEWKEYVLDKQRLDIQQQQLQLDILKYINAENERISRELGKVPVPQKPSLEVRPRL